MATKRPHSKKMKVPMWVLIHPSPIIFIFYYFKKIDDFDDTNEICEVQICGVHFGDPQSTIKQQGLNKALMIKDGKEP